MGYKVLWSPEAWGRDPFAHGGYLLAKTDQLIYATGIANIWVRDPMTMAMATSAPPNIRPADTCFGIWSTVLAENTLWVPSARSSTGR